MKKTGNVASKQISPLDEYKGNPEQAKADSKAVADSTEELIDMPFFEYAKFLEGKNIGELNAYRVLMQMNLDRADLVGKRLTDDVMIKAFGKDERIKIGSVFGIVNKIVDRMGYIDYLLIKNSIG